MSPSDKNDKKRARLKGRVSLAQKSDPGFILVPAVVVRSAAYARLSAYARAILGEITTLYRPADLGNNGSLCIALSAFEPLGWKRSRFYKSVDELVDAGFIVITRTGGNRIAAYCALTWLKIGPPMKKVGEYDPHIVIGSMPHKPWIKSVADHPTLSSSLGKKSKSVTDEDAAAKKRGVATQPDKSETGCQKTQFPPAESNNGLQDNTLEPIQPQETGCYEAHYKNLCHGQGDFSQHDGVDSFTGDAGELDTAEAAEEEHITKAKAECPVFSHVSSVIPLTLVWSHPKGVPTKQPKNPAPLSIELEAVATEFRELLIVGGITPAVAEKRMGEIRAAHGETVAIQFMREFIASKGKKICEERKPARTSGAIAAAVRWFKPAQLAA